MISIGLSVQAVDKNRQRPSVIRKTRFRPQEIHRNHHTDQLGAACDEYEVVWVFGELVDPPYCLNGVGVLVLVVIGDNELCA